MKASRDCEPAEQDPVAERLLPDDAADLLETPPDHRLAITCHRLGAPLEIISIAQEAKAKHDATPARP